jgi:serine/threonine protein kinase
MENKVVTVEKMNLLMIKAIDIIEHIHRFFVLHRDIKPQNFMVKNGDIFLIDFGLATFYVDENGQHYPDKPSDTIIGTPKFVSINIHLGHRYSRRDDLISLGYMYVYMILGQAPWFSNCVPFQTNKSLLAMDHPINILLKEKKEYNMFSNYILDIENRFYQINHYIVYTYALEYMDIPKYIPLKNIFQAS